LSQSLLAAGCGHGSVEFQQDARPGNSPSCPEDISSSKARALFKLFGPFAGDNMKANSHMWRADFYAAFISEGAR
jgi:hypothetical protein